MVDVDPDALTLAHSKMAKLRRMLLESRGEHGTVTLTVAQVGDAVHDLGTVLQALPKPGS